MRLNRNVQSRRTAAMGFREEYRPRNGDYRTAALDLLRAFLLCEDPVACERLSFWMRQIRFKSLTRPLLEAARYLPGSKHELVVYVLADLFDVRCTPFFRKMWRDTSRPTGIRCVSLEALGWNFGRKPRLLREELQLAVQDADQDVVMSAACILTYAWNPGFIDIRDRLLTNPGSSSGGRSLAEFVRKKVRWTA